MTVTPDTDPENIPELRSNNDLTLYSIVFSDVHEVNADEPIDSRFSGREIDSSILHESKEL